MTGSPGGGSDGSRSRETDGSDPAQGLGRDRLLTDVPRRPDLDLSDLGGDRPAGWRRWGPAVATVLGLLAALAGTVSSGVYVWAAAGVLGEPDRSVVFWYSGFLLFGILFTAAGVALLLVLTSELRADEAVLSRRPVRGVMWFLAGAGGLAAVVGVALAFWHILVF